MKILIHEATNKHTLPCSSILLSETQWNEEQHSCVEFQHPKWFPTQKALIEPVIG